MDKFEVGNLVLIDKDCNKTKIKYGINRRMSKMMGKIHKITEPNSINSVYIDTFIWHKSDLTPIFNKNICNKTTKKNIAPELFNMKNLIK